MLTYDRLREDSAALWALTGLSVAEFDALLPAFEDAWEAHLQANLTKQTGRKRRPGAGRKARLASIEDKLVFILFYVWRAPRQAQIGSLFNLSQGQVSVWTNRLHGVLEAALVARQPAARLSGFSRDLTAGEHNYA